MLGLKITSFGADNIPKELKSPLGTATDSTVVLIWDKPDSYADISTYAVFENGRYIGTSAKTNYTVHHLKPNTTYSFTNINY